jgi:hypothetical protein
LLPKNLLSKSRTSRKRGFFFSLLFTIGIGEWRSGHNPYKKTIISMNSSTTFKVPANALEKRESFEERCNSWKAIASTVRRKTSNAKNAAQKALDTAIDKKNDLLAAAKDKAGSTTDCPLYDAAIVLANTAEGEAIVQVDKAKASYNSQKAWTLRARGHYCNPKNRKNTERTVANIVLRVAREVSSAAKQAAVAVREANRAITEVNNCKKGKSYYL